MVHIGNSWDDILADEFKKEYYLKLREFLKYEYSHFTVYPDMHDIFNSLKYTPYENVKAVIIGQDPYHGPGQAHGLCFSVQKPVPPPPSLVNIFQELKEEHLKSGSGGSDCLSDCCCCLSLAISVIHMNSSSAHHNFLPAFS